MWLCRGCRRVTPGRDAVYCVYCSRSFGGRRCPHGHLSPADAISCARCRASDSELSQATGAVNIGWLPRLLAWGCVVGTTYLAWKCLRGAGTLALARLRLHLPWTAIADRILFWTLLLLVFGRRARAPVRAAGKAAFWSARGVVAVAAVLLRAGLRFASFVARRIVGD